METIVKTRDEYQSEAYRANGLPAAPAIMLDQDLLVQGRGISREELEEALMSVLQGHRGEAAEREEGHALPRRGIKNII